MFSKFLHGGLLVIFLFLGSGSLEAADFPSRVTLSAEPISESIAPGRVVDAHITITVENGWHIYAAHAIAPEGSDVYINQTRIDLASEQYELVGITWPVAHAWNAGDYTVDTYDGRVTAIVRIAVPEDAVTGSDTIVLNVFFFVMLKER